MPSTPEFPPRSHRRRRTGCPPRSSPADLRRGLAHEVLPIRERQADETTRQTNDVKAKPATFAQIRVDGGRTLREHEFNEPTGRGRHLMGMREVEQLFHRDARHERKRAAGKFQRVDMIAHGFEHIGGTACRGAREFLSACACRASLPRIGAEEGTGTFVLGGHDACLAPVDVAHVATHACETNLGNCKLRRRL